MSHTHTRAHTLLWVTVQSRGGQGRNFSPAPDLFLRMRCACTNITVAASLPAPRSWCRVYTDSSKEEGEEEPEPGEPSPPPPPPSQKHIPCPLLLPEWTSPGCPDPGPGCLCLEAMLGKLCNSVSGSPRALRDDLHLPTAISPWISVLLTFHLISQLAQKLGEKEESYSLDLCLVTITYLIISVPLSALWASPLLFQYVPGYLVYVECQTLAFCYGEKLGEEKN